MAMLTSTTQTFYLSQLVKKSFLALMSFSKNQQRERNLKIMGEYLIQKK
jgi:hypothetical protein